MTWTRRKLLLLSMPVLVAVIVAASLVAGSSEVEGVPDGAVYESEGISYEMAGGRGVLPMGPLRTVMIPVGMSAPAGSHVVLEDVTPAEVDGLEFYKMFMVQTPRTGDGYGPDREYPPKRRLWARSAEEPVAGAVVRTEDLPGPTGSIVIMVARMTEDYASVKGVWVEGTQDGKPFRDFSDANWIFCDKKKIDQACQDYTQQNSFGYNADVPS